MKKAISIILACALSMVLVSPVLAYNYEFGSGPESREIFGKATSTDEPVPLDTTMLNERRNKDAAYNPPPYGIFSGYIPTDQSSLYHSQTGIDNGGWITEGTAVQITASNENQISAIYYQTPVTDTEPKPYPDGSIGTICIARTGKTVKVYEGEHLDNLKKGAGHFSSTSAWDGNVILCGHNRGSWPHFAFVKDLQAGDRITFTTLYGTRTYEVFSKEQISEYDYSKLGWTSDNVLTLITCVANSPELRYAAQCREVR